MSADTVRLLVPDLGTPPVFDDDQIDLFLTLNDGDVYLAAADALDVMVSNLAMSGGAATIRTDDLTINDKEGLLALTERAKRLREQSATALGDTFTLVYPYESVITNDFEDSTWYWA